MADRTIVSHIGVPVLQNKVYSSPEAARLAMRGDIDLVQSADSGLVYNRAFDSTILNYDPDYQNEQACSDAFRRHLDDVLKTLLEIATPGKRGIEIGCGKGYFLELLCDAGVDIIGFDPAYQGFNPRVRKELFDKRSLRTAPDFIVLRHVLEHLPMPWLFLEELRATAKPDTIIYIEVPCFDWIVANNAFYDVFYEHVNYFTLDALGPAFSSQLKLGKFFGDQYLFLIANLCSFRIPTAYTGRRFEKLDFNRYLDTLLRQRRHKGGRTLIWGAGAKGVTFSNMLCANNIPVECLIDINPAKQGKFASGGGVPIKAPADVIPHLGGADVFVMNPLYRDEIILATDGAGANFISVA